MRGFHTSIKVIIYFFFSNFHLLTSKTVSKGAAPIWAGSDLYKSCNWKMLSLPLYTQDQHFWTSAVSFSLLFFHLPKQLSEVDFCQMFFFCFFFQSHGARPRHGSLHQDLPGWRSVSSGHLEYFGAARWDQLGGVHEHGHRSLVFLHSAGAQLEARSSAGTLQPSCAAFKNTQQCSHFSTYLVVLTLHRTVKSVTSLKYYKLVNVFA